MEISETKVKLLVVCFFWIIFFTMMVPTICSDIGETKTLVDKNKGVYQRNHLVTFEERIFQSFCIMIFMTIFSIAILSSEIVELLKKTKLGLYLLSPAGEK